MSAVRTQSGLQWVRCLVGSLLTFIFVDQLEQQPRIKVRVHVIQKLELHPSPITTTTSYTRLQQQQQQLALDHQVSLCTTEESTVMTVHTCMYIHTCAATYCMILVYAYTMCVQYCLFVCTCLPDEIHEVAAICRGLTKEFAVPGSNFERWYKSAYTHTYSERASAIIHTHVYVCRRYMYIAHMYAYVLTD